MHITGPIPAEQPTLVAAPRAIGRLTRGRGRRAQATMFTPPSTYSVEPDSRFA
jgi:hypothetical protein